MDNDLGFALGGSIFSSSSWWLLVGALLAYALGVVVYFANELHSRMSDRGMHDGLLGVLSLPLRLFRNH